MNEFIQLNDDTKYEALVQYNSMDPEDRQIVHEGLRQMTDDQMLDFLAAVCHNIAAMRATTQAILEESRDALIQYGYKKAQEENR